MDKSVVVVGAVRTTVGRRNGGWSAVHPARLLGAAQRAVLDGVDPAVVGQVIGGTVTEVGEQSFNVTRTSQLEGLYHLPFGKFERLTPAGTAAQVAEALAPYCAAGAAHITLVPAAASPEAGVEHAVAVRAALGDVG